MEERGMVRSHAIDSLHPIVPFSPLLEIVGRKVRPKDSDEMIEVPTNEFGIPQPRQFLINVMGSLATQHYWQGDHDVHHLAWPGSKHREITHESDELLGARYRGCATLKLKLPRQLHNYIHKVTLEPVPPSSEVMMQWVFEQEQVNRLYDTIKLASLAEADFLHEIKDRWRHQSYIDKLDGMKDGKLGLMPERNFLANLELDDARRTLRALARVQGISNAKSCKRAYFGKIAA